MVIGKAAAKMYTALYLVLNVHCCWYKKNLECVSLGHGVVLYSIYSNYFNALESEISYDSMKNKFNKNIFC